MLSQLVVMGKLESQLMCTSGQRGKNGEVKLYSRSVFRHHFSCHISLIDLVGCHISLVDPVH